VILNSNVIDNLNLFAIRSKVERDKLVLNYIRDVYFQTITPDLCNFYSYKLHIENREHHIMLYSSTNKIYDDVKRETRVYSTLGELDEILKEYING
jgi:hypothetical protein